MLKASPVFGYFAEEFNKQKQQKLNTASKSLISGHISIHKIRLIFL